MLTAYTTLNQGLPNLEKIKSNARGVMAAALLSLSVALSGCSVSAHEPFSSTSPSPIVEPSLTPTSNLTPTPTVLSPTASPEPTLTPTPNTEVSFYLLPTMMDKDLAKKFLVGGEFMDEEKLRQFDGRVFTIKDNQGNPTNTVIFSQEAQKSFPGGKIEESEWVRILNEIKAKKYPLYGDVIFSSLSSEGNPVIITIKPDPPEEVAKRKNISGLPIAEVTRGKLYTRDAKTNSLMVRSFEFPSREFSLGINYWDNEKGTVVAHDGYQIRYTLEINDQGQPSWRHVLPHERKNGEYEILTPEQRMRKAIADLKEITGYDGSGLWEKRPNTVVDYTDTQGQKRHQEVEIYFVHASQDPKSTVVYEVIKDPATGEMMFTIRKAKEANKENIQGLNEQQAALVRQAWAYLLAADPAVMQKFWRVNKVTGAGVNPNLNLLSTHNLEQGVGLIIFNPHNLEKWKNKQALILDILLTESYELYTGSQFRVGFDNWRYIGEKPPDCLDDNAIADAAKRVLEWFERYGKSLPKDVYYDAISVSERWLEGLNRFPCQPQIPFEP